ncbi:hypothetical protein BHM03_00050285 [Ensete ventricosum]|nr:hypothetical protein BHM03_00050285 [Ensete ventricosum]
MRPVFVGNLESDTRHSDLDRLFSKYGRVDRIDMKSGRFLPFSFSFLLVWIVLTISFFLTFWFGSKILDRMVTVEYAFRDDDDGDHGDVRESRGGYGGRQDDRAYGRSDSPGHRRGRPSPDYGRARSPVYDRYNGPSYDRSPEYGPALLPVEDRGLEEDLAGM